jgi:hypothetical protein
MRWPALWDHIFRHLHKVRYFETGYWTACCPSHDDEHPSLSLRLGRNGDLLVYCHANRGCTLSSIANSLGLRRYHFFVIGRKVVPGVCP